MLFMEPAELGECSMYMLLLEAEGVEGYGVLGWLH